MNALTAVLPGPRCGKCKNCRIASNRTCNTRALFVTANTSMKPYGDETQYPCSTWVPIEEHRNA